MKRKNKGFTLVELLVCITILGLITAMAMPSIIRLYESNTKTKYETYEDTAVAAAKLYVDAYSVDMFKSSSTEEVSLDTLIGKKLLKPIKVKGDTCSGEIIVTKNGNKYTYVPAITCTNKNGATVYETKSEQKTTYPN